MACSAALYFATTNVGSSDEEFLVNELSKIRQILSEGFQYFDKSSSSSGLADLKEHVILFIKDLSAYIRLPEDKCYDILLDYLATHEQSGDCDLHHYVTDERMSTLLNRVRSFYWQERLNLIALFKISLCSWGTSWALLSDVLFTMTSKTTRSELVDFLLKEYIRMTKVTEGFINESYSSVRSTLVLGLQDMDSCDEFDIVLEQHLREQLELLQAVLIGVHALPLNGSEADRFKRFLETFWSNSFGFYSTLVHPISRHYTLIESICFTQAMILIRSAHLDSLVLFPSRNEKRVKSHTRNPSNHPMNSQRMNADRAGRDDVKRHFLTDAGLLNRLLTSLSDLGELRAHGPLLLLGAVCATSFIPMSQKSDPNYGIINSSNLPDDDQALIANRFAQLSIEILKVFDFIFDRLQYSDGLISTAIADKFATATSSAQSSTMGLTSFCTHVATFDLLALMTRDVVLWTLDSTQALAILHNMDTAALPNRASFIHLFSRVLKTMVQNLPLVSRMMDSKKDTNATSATAFSNQVSPIGTRITGLIQSLTEGFPCDLSIVRLFNSLLWSSSPSDTIGCSDERSVTLVTLVNELLNSMPCLAESVTPELSVIIERCSAAWYPCMGDDGEFHSNDRVILNRPHIVLSAGASPYANDRPSSSGGVCTRKNLQSGITLPAGTRGVFKPHLNLLVWEYEHSIWSVTDYELYLSREAVYDLLQLRNSGSKNLNQSQLGVSDTNGSALAFCCTNMQKRLKRLNELVQLAAACVEVGVHIDASLAFAGKVWDLIMYCFDVGLLELFSDAEFHAESTERNLQKNVKSLLYGQILPGLFRLFGSALSIVFQTGSDKLMSGHSLIWQQFFDGCLLLFPRMLVTTGVKRVDWNVSLLSSHLLAGPLASADSNAKNLVPASNHIELLLSYLSLCSNLLMMSKQMSDPTSSLRSCVPSLLVQCTELLKGSLLFVINSLLSNDRLIEWSNIDGLETCIRAKLFIMAERSLILLTDLLTTRASDKDLNQLQSDDLEQIIICGLSTSSMSPSPYKISDPNSINLFEFLQCLALRLLLNNSAALHCLLSFSSIKLRTLLDQWKTAERGLSISPCHENSRCESDSINTGSSVARVVWLSLSLVHHLLVLEYTLTSDQAPESKRLLWSNLRNYIDASRGDHYVVTLFSYLHYPYNVGLARNSIAILKWISQYTSLSLVDCINQDAPAIRKTILFWLTCRTQDQLTRAGLFDLLAESVLCPATEQQTRIEGAAVTRTTSLLRLVQSTGEISLNSESSSSGIIRQILAQRKSVTTRENSTQSGDCMQSVFLTLQELSDAVSRSDISPVSTVLLWSVCKFISAVYLQGLYSCISVFKENSSFWQMFTDPLFHLLAHVKKKEDLSNVEVEICGHIFTVISLEFFCLNGQFPKPGSPFSTVLKRLSKDDSYGAWFTLVVSSLETLNATEADPISYEQLMQSRMQVLHGVTCRVKSILQLYLNTIKSDFQSSEAFLVQPIVTQLGNCLTVLAKSVQSPARWDLCNQLATCFTMILKYQFRSPPLQTISTNQSNTSSNDLDVIGTANQLIGWLNDFYPSVTDQIHHLHTDLLASCCITIRKLLSMDQSDENSPQLLLLSSALDCNFRYFQSLTLKQQLSRSERDALCQVIDLLLLLWTSMDYNYLCLRLSQTGILNNLIVILRQYSQNKDGSLLCLSIVSLLIRIVLTSNRSDSIARGKSQSIFSNIDNISQNSASSPSTFGAELVVSFTDLLSQAFRWPSSDTLFRWIEEQEVALQTSVSFVDGTLHSNASDAVLTFLERDNGHWTVLLLLELRLLCLIYDLLGGLNHPSVGRLIDSFICENSSQLEHMLTDWCSHLYNQPGSNRSRSSLPPTISLLRDGSISVHRLRMAESACAFYWRLMSAGHLFRFSLPTISKGILFCLDSQCIDSEDCMRPCLRRLPTYGPICHPEFCDTTWHLVQLQLHSCALLLQRTGLKSYSRTSGPTTSHVTPVKLTASNTASTGQLEDTPIRSGKRASMSVTKSSDLSVSERVSLDSSFPYGLELIPLARHLVASLCLLVTQLPMLGCLSLMSSEELHQIQSPMLVCSFSSPHLEDKSPQLTFGVLLSLVHAIGNLLPKFAGLLRAGQGNSPHCSSMLERWHELWSLLYRAQEMILSVIFSQTTLILASGHTSPADKQLLVRELVSELKSCNAYGKSRHRRAGSARRSSQGPSRSPSSQRSSSVQHQRSRTNTRSPSSTYTPANVLSTSFSIDHCASAPVGTRLRLQLGDSTEFDYEQATDRFTELLRLTV